MSAPKPSPIPVAFFWKEVKDERQSKIEGRDVMLREPWAKIRPCVGQILIRQVTAADRETYSLEYAAFEKGEPAPGTPLQVLAEADPNMLSAEGIDEIKGHYGFTTLEQIVAAPDGSFKYGAGRAVQRRAKEVLEARAADAVAAKATERETEAAGLRNRVAALEARLEQINRAIAPKGVE